MDGLNDEAQKITKEIFNIDKEIYLIECEIKRLHANRKQLNKKKLEHTKNLNSIMNLIKNGGILS